MYFEFARDQYTQSFDKSANLLERLLKKTVTYNQNFTPYRPFCQALVGWTVVS